jgi:putative membrane protein
MSLKAKRVLVISVDKDNDVGRVTGVATPVMGRDKVASVATLFAIKSPEDSDTNSIFASINTYDSLIDEGFICEVAIVAGSEEGGFKADLKISSELDYILSNFKAEGLIFVSDGVADEQVIPTIQSKIPVISVKRVFVQQERSVEETYVLFYRYLKKIADPEYSKLALGVPGIIILAIIALYFANLLSYALISLGIIIGVVLILKGFYVDRFLRSEWEESPIKLISYIIGFIISAVAIYRGISIALIDVKLPEQAALFASLALVNIIDLFAIGVAVYMGGRLVVKYLNESPKLWHEIVGLVALVFVRQMVIEAAPIIENPMANLIPFLLIAGLGAFVCGFLVIIFSLTPRFRKRVQVETPQKSSP